MHNLLVKQYLEIVGEAFDQQWDGQHRLKKRTYPKSITLFPFMAIVSNKGYTPILVHPRSQLPRYTQTSGADLKFRSVTRI